VGWLLMVPGLVLSGSELTAAWLAALDPAPAEMTPALWIVLWAMSWSWILLIFPLFHLLLTFPDGRLLSPLWRWVVLLEGVMMLTMLVVAAVTDRMGVTVNDEVVWSVANPVGFLSADGFDSQFGNAWSLSLVVVTVAAATAVVLRFRRGTREQRQQLKWPLLAVVTFGVVYGVSATGADLAGSSFGGLLFGVAIAGIPISVAIAVLRYRLYEIDRIISRTIAWIVLTVILAGVFAGVVLGLQAVLAPFTRENTLSVAVSTLVAAALFQPLRGRIQHVVDRRFNRAHYDAARTAEGFGAQLRGSTDLAGVDGALVTAVATAVQPGSVAVWLRAGR
jgi:hypothetical protein